MNLKDKLIELIKMARVRSNFVDKLLGGPFRMYNAARAAGYGRLLSAGHAVVDSINPTNTILGLTGIDRAVKAPVRGITAGIAKKSLTEGVKEGVLGAIDPPLIGYNPASEFLKKRLLSNPNTRAKVHEALTLKPYNPPTPKVH